MRKVYAGPVENQTALLKTVSTYLPGWGSGYLIFIRGEQSTNSMLKDAKPVVDISVFHGVPSHFWGTVASTGKGLSIPFIRIKVGVTLVNAVPKSLNTML
jgi:hypothetical protein